MRTLLLADDSITVQRVIALTFAGQDIRVVAVGDGQQAIESMAAQPPDVVLAGTTLPRVSGYDLGRHMRKTPALRSVPLLLLSGAFETVDEAQLAASGANGVIEKPVEPTIVINRVKELLGLKSETKPATAGRSITSPSAPAEKKKLPVPTPPRAVTSTRGTPSKWQQLRDQSGLEPSTPSVEDASTRPDGYLDTLDEAFDSLDQQLSGRAPNSAGPRNPSGPLGQSSGSADPRSPGRSPQNGSGVPGNPVFEVDDDWFGGEDSPARANAKANRREIAEDLRDPGLQMPAPAVAENPIFESDDEWFDGKESQARADAKAGRREITEDLRDPDLQGPPVSASPNPIFEVDDEWFVEDDKARTAKTIERQQLAAEMGIHDVEVPAVTPELTSAPAADLDLAFGIKASRPPVEAEPPAPSRPMDALDALLAPQAPQAPKAPEPAKAPSFLVPLPPIAAPTEAASTAVADDFALLLAFEQGEHHEPPSRELPTAPITDEMLDQIARRVPVPAPAEITDEMLSQIAARVPVPAPAPITDEMLSQIAARVAQPEPAPITYDMLEDIAGRVAERLHAGQVGDELRAAVNATVRSVVSETAERLVRDEIERIKAKPRP